MARESCYAETMKQDLVGSLKAFCVVMAIGATVFYSIVALAFYIG